MLLQYKNLDITVNLGLGKSNRSFTFTKNGIFTRVICLDTVPDSENEQLTMNWLEQKYDTENNLILVTKHYRTISSQEEYLKWATYNLDNVTGTLLNIIFSPTINSILSLYFKEPNLYCFNPLFGFRFFQPIIFECQATENSISIDIENGTGTLRYSIDGGKTWQGENVFLDLESSTEYEIFVKTIEEKWISKRKIRTSDAI
jgi:hypothetical protein